MHIVFHSFNQTYMSAIYYETIIELITSFKDVNEILPELKEWDRGRSEGTSKSVRLPGNLQCETISKDIEL